ncbi:MAG: hypothetical protein OEN56_07320 [Gemmatimonadota bacterium]|nr:hypothetical protein [Gemmatimonadota bacterium]
MQILPIDVTGLVAVVLGISIVLIPVLGATARFALSPVVEALAKLFEARGADEHLRILERRVELQEQEIAMLSQTVRSLSEARDFDRALGSGPPGSPPADQGTS